ncbi:integrase, catalytic region, zinc finger, CCHC-type containing protein [Tanacetum coccineum]
MAGKGCALHHWVHDVFFNVSNQILNLNRIEAIQADCDIKAINIILQGLPTEIYALVSQHRRQTSFATGTSRTYTLGACGSNSRKQRTVICYNCKGEGYMSKKINWHFWQDPRIPKVKPHRSVIPYNAAYQDDDLDAYDSDCDELNTAKVALMANLSHYGSNALSEVHNHDNVNNDMPNQVVQAIPSSELSNVVNHSETEITSDSNIIPYSQYLIESQQAAVQNSNSHAQQDDLILSVDLNNSKTQGVCKELIAQDNMENKDYHDTLTTEIERIRNTVKVFDRRKNVDLRKNSVNSFEPTLSIRPTNVEVPKELPKVSMVNTSLKKLKHHLANFDVVVKERTTPTTITKGMWGFKHIKACFRDEIIPFVKALKDLFSTFNQHLVDELSEVQNVFYQMEQAVEQHRLESKTCEVRMNQVLNENERFLEQVMSKDIMNIYDELYKSFSILEKHCISLEVDSQLKQEIFQRDNFISNQTAPSFDQLFELNELKAQSQEKDTVIKKLKERIKSLSGKMYKDKVKHDFKEIETINIELDHRVTKLIAENEHLKQTYQQLYDSIKPVRIQSKEQSAELINQVNLKSVEIYDLNASLKEKALVITALKDELKKLKGKSQVDKIELLSKISKTCPSINSSGEQLVAVTLMNKVKRVRFTKPVTSSSNTKIAHTSTQASNKPMLSSTGVKPSTSASGSQPSGNTKKDKIRQTPSSTQKNKVEAHPRKVKSSFKNKDCVVQPKGTAHVQHSKLNANSELKCVKCNGCMLFDNHDLCVLDFINNVNARKKSKSVNKSSKRKVWKPTGKVFSNIGYIWRPTGRTFTIVGNACPLTRITTTTEVPLRKPTALDNETSKPVVTLVYSRKPRKSKTNVPVSKSKVVQIVLWYLDSGCSKHMTGDRSQLTNFVNKFLGTVKFGNDHVAKILGYGDYQIGNVTISRVYYVEGLGHNLFSVGQFCDSNLEVAFRQHTCFIRNLEGVDLLTGSRGNNLYTLSLGDMMASSPICLLSKASKTKSWLWHRRLSHLNFGAINHLARHGLVRGLPKLKFEKDHENSKKTIGT